MMNSEQKKRQLAQADEHIREAIATLLAASLNCRNLDARSALEALDSARVTVELAETQLAAHLRSFGATWQEIGDALHISRQTAFARYSPRLHG